MYCELCCINNFDLKYVSLEVGIVVFYVLRERVVFVKYNDDIKIINFFGIYFKLICSKGKYFFVLFENSLM